MEVELKLSLAPQDAEALRQHPLLKQYAMSTPYEQDMSDTYFDTPDLQFRHCDAGLRVRRLDTNDWIQTLKGGGSVDGGLHSRHEWESRLAGSEPDLAALRKMVDHKSAWGKLLRSPQIEEQLAPIFTTRVRRMVWDLRLPQGDEVECVLDQGRVELADRNIPISEVELELKSGDPAHLFDFALSLQQDIPLQIGNLSKADRGYALLAPQPPAAVKATRVKLSKRMSIEQAFQAIVANCMAHIQANAAGVAQALDVESVESLHQMRVGLRRLHSALGLFQDVLRTPEDLQSELDWLGTQLDAARDWDVLAGTTLPALADTLPYQAGLAKGLDNELADGLADGLAELRLAALDQAHEQHQVAALAVGSARYTRLLLRFTRWLQGCDWRRFMAPRDQRDLTARIPVFARRSLEYYQRRLLKRGGKLDAANPEARHRVRIAAKKARYANEFFGSLYQTKKVKRYVAALARLQDELGWLNDAAVADGLLAQLRDGQPGREHGAGLVRGYLASRVKNDDKHILSLWRKFKPLKLPC